VKTKVLVSPGFGAGWSTWNSQAQYELATDSELIRLFETGERDAFEERANLILQTVTGDSVDTVYMGGYDQLQVEEAYGDWYIEEYDGSERLQEIETAAWRPSGKFPGGAA
jgi:hypothetical protein